MKGRNFIICLGLMLLISSCDSGAESDTSNSEVPKSEIMLEGAWKLFNIELQTTLGGGLRKDDMKSGDIIYYFTKDSLFIVSSLRNLVLATTYTLENGILTYNSSDKSKKKKVKKKVGLRAGVLRLKSTESDIAAVVSEFDSTQLDMAQLNYLQANKIDWRLCSGDWVFDRNYPRGSEFNIDEIELIPLAIAPIDTLKIDLVDSNLNVNQDTLNYWLETDSTYSTFVYEIFRKKEGGKDELHLNRILPSDEPNQTFVYIINHGN